MYNEEEDFQGTGGMEITNSLIKAIKKANADTIKTIAGSVLFGKVNEGYPLSENNADLLNAAIFMFSQIAEDERMMHIRFDQGLNKEEAISNYRTIQATLKEMEL